MDRGHQPEVHGYWIKGLPKWATAVSKSALIPRMLSINRPGPWSGLTAWRELLRIIKVVRGGNFTAAATDLGYLTVYAGSLLAENKMVNGAKSIQAGRLGDLEIRGSDIILGTPLIINNANVDQFDF
jgi:hypothetical protein